MSDQIGSTGNVNTSNVNVKAEVNESRLFTKFTKRLGIENTNLDIDTIEEQGEKDGKKFKKVYVDGFIEGSQEGENPEVPVPTDVNAVVDKKEINEAAKEVVNGATEMVQNEIDKLAQNNRPEAQIVIHTKIKNVEQQKVESGHKSYNNMIYRSKAFLSNFNKNPDYEIDGAGVGTISGYMDFITKGCKEAENTFDAISDEFQKLNNPSEEMKDSLHQAYQNVVEMHSELSQAATIITQLPFNNSSPLKEGITKEYDSYVSEQKRYSEQWKNNKDKSKAKTYIDENFQFSEQDYTDRLTKLIREEIHGIENKIKKSTEGTDEFNQLTELLADKWIEYLSVLGEAQSKLETTAQNLIKKTIDKINIKTVSPQKQKATPNSTGSTSSTRNRSAQSQNDYLRNREQEDLLEKQTEMAQKAREQAEKAKNENSNLARILANGLGVGAGSEGALTYLQSLCLYANELQDEFVKTGDSVDEFNNLDRNAQEEVVKRAYTLLAVYQEIDTVIDTINKAYSKGTLSEETVSLLKKGMNNDGKFVGSFKKTKDDKQDTFNGIVKSSPSNRANNKKQIEEYVNNIFNNEGNKISRDDANTYEVLPTDDIIQDAVKKTANSIKENSIKAGLFVVQGIEKEVSSTDYEGVLSYFKGKQADVLSNKYEGKNKKALQNSIIDIINNNIGLNGSPKQIEDLQPYLDKMLEMSYVLDILLNKGYIEKDKITTSMKNYYYTGEVDKDGKFKTTPVDNAADFDNVIKQLLINVKGLTDNGDNSFIQKATDGFVNRQQQRETDKEIAKLEKEKEELQDKNKKLADENKTLKQNKTKAEKKEKSSVSQDKYDAIVQENNSLKDEIERQKQQIETISSDLETANNNQADTQNKLRDVEQERDEANSRVDETQREFNNYKQKQEGNNNKNEQEILDAKRNILNNVGLDSTAFNKIAKEFNIPDFEKIPIDKFSQLVNLLSKLKVANVNGDSEKQTEILNSILNFVQDVGKKSSPLSAGDTDLLENEIEEYKTAIGKSLNPGKGNVNQNIVFISEELKRDLEYIFNDLDSVLNRLYGKGKWKYNQKPDYKSLTESIEDSDLYREFAENSYGGNNFAEFFKLAIDKIEENKNRLKEKTTSVQAMEEQMGTEDVVERLYEKLEPTLGLKSTSSETTTKPSIIITDADWPFDDVHFEGFEEIIGDKWDPNDWNSFEEIAGRDETSSNSSPNIVSDKVYDMLTGDSGNEEEDNRFQMEFASELDKNNEDVANIVRKYFELFSKENNIELKKATLSNNGRSTSGTLTYKQNGEDGNAYTYTQSFEFLKDELAETTMSFKEASEYAGNAAELAGLMGYNVELIGDKLQINYNESDINKIKDNNSKIATAFQIRLNDQKNRIDNEIKTQGSRETLKTGDDNYTVKSIQNKINSIINSSEVASQELINEINVLLNDLKNNITNTKKAETAAVSTMRRHSIESAYIEKEITNKSIKNKIENTPYLKNNAELTDLISNAFDSEDSVFNKGKNAGIGSREKSQYLNQYLDLMDQISKKVLAIESENNLTNKAKKYQAEQEALEAGYENLKTRYETLGLLRDAEGNLTQMGKDFYSEQNSESVLSYLNATKGANDNGKLATYRSVEKKFKTQYADEISKAIEASKETENSTDALKAINKIFTERTKLQKEINDLELKQYKNRQRGNNASAQSEQEEIDRLKEKDRLLQEQLDKNEQIQKSTKAQNLLNEKNKEFKKAQEDSNKKLEFDKREFDLSEANKANKEKLPIRKDNAEEVATLLLARVRNLRKIQGDVLTIEKKIENETTRKTYNLADKENKLVELIQQLRSGKYTATTDDLNNLINLDALTANEVKLQSSAKSVKSLENQYDSLIISIKDYINTNSQIKFNPEMYKRINDFINQITTSTNKSTIELDKFKQEWKNIKSEVIEKKLNGKNVLDAFSTKFNDIIIRNIGSFAAGAAGNYFRQMVSNVKEIDSAMTQLKKVTTETSDTYDKFLTNAGKRAEALGSTMTGLINSTADFAKLGYNVNQAAILAENAIMYSNVGDLDIETATNDIVSATKAFSFTAEETGRIVDSFNEVGNNFAVSAAQIGEGLRNSASSLVVAGNSMDESIAMLTAMTEIECCLHIRKLICFHYIVIEVAQNSETPSGIGQYCG